MLTRRPCPHCGGTGFRRDDPDAAGLITAIAAHVGSAAFSACELVDHAKLTSGALRASLGDLNARRLGKLLSQIEGQEYDGVTITRIGSSNQGLIWLASRV